MMFKLRLVPVAVLAIAIAYALLVPWAYPVDPHAVDLGAVLQAPTSAHFFGTDALGRDIWLRAAAALRMSLFLALLASLCSTLLGVGIGVFAAWRGGLVDKIAMRLVDTTNALPHLLLAVIVVALWRGQWWAIVLSIALTHWTQVARIVRARLMTERVSDYVALAVASGAPPRSIWFTHLLPAVIPQAAIAVALQLPHAIWHESSLSFLGVGLPPESASLGLLLEDARGGILIGAWWLLVFPAGILVLVSWATLSLTHTEAREASGFFRFLMRKPQKPAQHSAASSLEEDSHSSFALRTEALSLWLPQPHTPVIVEKQILREINFTAKNGEITVILGHSGAGKSQLLRALAGLSPAGSRRTGEIMLSGTRMNESQLTGARGKELTFVPGSAATSLNPVRTVAAQLRQTLKLHRQPANIHHVLALLTRVNLEPGLANRYPHELSGGQAQRVVLALGLATESALLLLDEPTSALDTQTRTVIQNLLLAQAADGLCVVVVSHDLDFAREIADHLCIMENGVLIESGTADDILNDPAHPYTQGLLGSHI